MDSKRFADLSKKQQTALDSMIVDVQKKVADRQQERDFFEAELRSARHSRDFIESVHFWWRCYCGEGIYKNQRARDARRGLWAA